MCHILLTPYLVFVLPRSWLAAPMALTQTDREYPTTSNKTVQNFAGKAVAKMNSPSLKKMLDNKISAKKHASIDHLSLADMQKITLLGTDELPIEEAFGLFGGEAIRAVNKANVENVAKILVKRGYVNTFPLTVGVVPIQGSSQKEVRIVVCSSICLRPNECMIPL